jgi:hypothetical protein
MSLFPLLQHPVRTIYIQGLQDSLQPPCQRPVTKEWVVSFTLPASRVLRTSRTPWSLRLNPNWRRRGDYLDSRREKTLLPHASSSSSEILLYNIRSLQNATGTLIYSENIDARRLKVVEYIKEHLGSAPCPAEYGYQELSS